jgi:hypothetical protein
MREGATVVFPDQLKRYESSSQGNHPTQWVSPKRRACNLFLLTSEPPQGAV